MWSSLAYGLIIGTCIMVGCEDTKVMEETQLQDAFVVRDSAGVLIAESADSSWTQETAWQVEAEPFVQIGSRSATEPGVTFGRVGPVISLPSGRIAVGDQQTMEILVFDTAGRLLGRWGGVGRGPGELQRLDQLAVFHGDSVVARDHAGFKHEIYGSEGRYARTVSGPMPSATGGMAETVGWLEDGSFIVATPKSRSPQLNRGRQIATGEWHLFDSDGKHIRRLAVFPERLVEVRGTPPRPLPVAYAPRVQSVTDATGLWHAFPNHFEMRHISSEKGLDRIVRRKWSPSPVPEALKQDYEAWFESGPLAGEVSEAALFDYVTLSRAKFEASRSERADFSLPIADTLPAFVGLMLSGDGYVWVQEYATVPELLATGPDAVATARWTVFDPDGRWLGTVEMPSGLSVRAIESNYVVGVWLDSLDVPVVRLHRIVKH